MTDLFKWTETNIARALNAQFFQRKHLMVVPNCNWTGHECDLLVITENLRIIDVEIKISRADLKADMKKDKWFHSYDWKTDGPYTEFKNAERRRREWPRKVWKHYYVMPQEIWKEELFEFIPEASGVLLLRRDHELTLIKEKRRAKPNREAEHISAVQAIDIARLASLRMWDAYSKVVA